MCKIITSFFLILIILIFHLSSLLLVSWYFSILTRENNTVHSFIPQVHNLEEKLVTVIDRVKQAESYQSVEENLMRVKTWIQQDARKVVEQIDTSKLDLPNRLEKMEMLEGGIIEYRRKLADIAASEWFGKYIVDTL